MSKELDSKMKAYFEKFGDSFPTYQVIGDESEESFIKMIDECLKKGKDVFEMGYAEDAGFNSY